MAIAELIQKSDIAFENFSNKKTSVTNTEVKEMGRQSASNLGLNRQEKFYEVEERRIKFESYGYIKMTLDEISMSLFNKKTRCVGIREDLKLHDKYRYNNYGFGMKNGSTQISLNHYTKHTIAKETPFEWGGYKIWKGYGDKVHFIDTTSGFFGTSVTLGYLSSPEYLNQPIPAELLSRMETLSKSGLINCFYAAGFEKAFDFKEDTVTIEKIDPIILAVIDENFGMSSPFNQNTHMYFVGKYN